MFRASAPVTASAFHDRRGELQILSDAFGALTAGAPTWLALIGPRKVGKTSLLLEAARRSEHVRVAFIDVMERWPPTAELFRALVLRAVDVLLGERVAGSFSRAARDARRFAALVRRAELPEEVAQELAGLAAEPATPEAIRQWLELPERVAAHTEQWLVVVIDEVQELAALVSPSFDPFPTLRAVWQHHQRVAYVLSGSAPSALRELVTARHSPFFQHFRIIDLGGFARADAVALLTEEAPPDRPISPLVADLVYERVGGHPFYLQLVGEALVATEPPYDGDSLKAVFQSLLFSRTGRLGLYFENEYQRLVGRASTAAAALQAVAEHGPLRLTDVAKHIGAPTASAAKYLERLGDAFVRDEDGRYRLADRLFAWWIAWRSPGGTVVPMTVLGDEAEISVARALAALGFDLVYQSRASRGAFDLLAVRGADQVGVQVRRRPLPLRFPRGEWGRMEADAARFEWRWLIAAVDGAEVRFLDPGLARAGKEVRLGVEATIENLLKWVDDTRR